MDRDEAKERVTEVTVSASKKKQLDQYEPAEAHTSFKAEVLKDDDPEELRETLNEMAWEGTEEAILERWEQHVRKGEE